METLKKANRVAVMWAGASIFFVILFLFWIYPIFAQGPPVSHLIVTDVTPVSFSVMWTSSAVLAFMSGYFW